MSRQQLLEPIIEGGIHSTHYFNGRRLTAEDMDREKRANRQHERLLGQAIGEGIVYGLEVGLPGGQVSGGTTLEIQKGLAVNRNGDALYLPDKISLSLVPPSDEEQIPKYKFKDCSKIDPFEFPINTGVYVLLIRPADELSGRAPMSSIPDNGNIIGCGKSELVEGVQFRVVKMDLNGPAFDGLNESTKKKLMEVSTQSDDKDVSMFRNIVAHACFGTEEVKRFVEDPFGVNDLSNYGAIDILRSLKEDSRNKITDVDVPLSIFRWTQEKIQFVDMWSVRRKTYGLFPVKTWPAAVSQRRLAESEARFFQFQDQIESLTMPIIVQNELNSIEVQKYFRYLPAIGIIPITTGSVEDYYKEKAGKLPGSLTGQDRGFEYRAFFKNMNFRDPVFIEGARVGHIIRTSHHYQPFDPGTKEMVWLYLIRENLESIIAFKILPTKVSMIFTNGHMPFSGKARFDLSRWDRSNYSSILLGPG